MSKHNKGSHSHATPAKPSPAQPAAAVQQTKPVPIKTLDQKRAEFVWNKLVGIKQRDPVTFDAYTKLCKGAGTLIMQNGLLPTLAFYGEKSGGAASLAKGKEHQFLLEHLLFWLKEQSLITDTTFKEAINNLITKTSPEYRTITEECLSLIRWIRHFASALNKVEQ